MSGTNFIGAFKSHFMPNTYFNEKKQRESQTMLKIAKRNVAQTTPINSPISPLHNTIINTTQIKSESNKEYRLLKQKQKKQIENSLRNQNRAYQVLPIMNTVPDNSIATIPMTIPTIPMTRRSRLNNSIASPALNHF